MGRREVVCIVPKYLIRKNTARNRYLTSWYFFFLFFVGFIVIFKLGPHLLFTSLSLLANHSPGGISTSSVCESQLLYSHGFLIPQIPIGFFLLPFIPQVLIYGGKELLSHLTPIKRLQILLKRSHSLHFS